MIVTHNIGILSARIRLVALKVRHGGVLRQGLDWRLISKGALAANQEPLYASQQAQPTLDIPAGTYDIELTYRDKLYCLAQDVELKQNTHTDAVFVLDAAGEYEQESGYHINFDEGLDYERRVAERESQQKFAEATMPLRDPHQPKGDHGVQFQGHPLLNSAQFDGMEAKVNPQPSENEDANAKSAQLILQKQAQLQHANVSAPTPGR